MKPLRLAMISRRFWPLLGGAETVMARLAAGFQARGASATLLTAQWQPDWPMRFEHHGVRVERLRQPARRMMGTLAYMSGVRRWLKSHRADFDLAYVSMLKHDAYAAISAANGSRFPVVLRAEGAGATGDCQWQKEANFGGMIRRRCQRASAIVAPSPTIESELLAAGYARQRVHYIPNGVPLPQPTTEGMRLDARRALADGRPALAIPFDAPLAVYIGRLHPMKGLDTLVDAWARLAAASPTPPYLWIVGEGPYRDELAGRIQRARVPGWVTLTGAFDDVEDVLKAANLLVLPSLEEGMSLALLEAMATGLPVVATDIPANRVIVDDTVHGRLVPPRDPVNLASAVTALLASDERRRKMGSAGRARVEREFSLDVMIDRHLALFDELLRSKQSRSA